MSSIIPPSGSRQAYASYLRNQDLSDRNQDLRERVERIERFILSAICVIATHILAVLVYLLTLPAE